MPIHVSVLPSARTYELALLLALFSGLLCGISSLRADPYEVIKAGTQGVWGYRVSLRDVLLVLQIGVCTLLV
jgi:hypothetical protein